MSHSQPGPAPLAATAARFLLKLYQQGCCVRVSALPSFEQARWRLDSLLNHTGRFSHGEVVDSKTQQSLYQSYHDCNCSALP